MEVIPKRALPQYLQQVLLWCLRASALRQRMLAPHLGPLHRTQITELCLSLPRVWKAPKDSLPARSERRSSLLPQQPLKPIKSEGNQWVKGLCVQMFDTFLQFIFKTFCLNRERKWETYLELLCQHHRDWQLPRAARLSLARQCMCRTTTPLIYSCNGNRNINH